MEPEAIAQVLRDHKQWLDSNGADGKRAVLTGTDLSQSDLTKSILTEAIINQANLNEAILIEVDLSRAILRRSTLMNANLVRANLSHAVASKTDFYEANLSRANLEYAVLTKAILSEINFNEANLSYSLLTKSNLTGSNFVRANLSYANLVEADLRNAILDSADLSYADLRGANLGDVDLAGVELTGVNLKNAELSLSTLLGLPEDIRRQYESTMRIAMGSEETVIRSKTFPPEYLQAGVSLLNYFGTVLRQKYPQKKTVFRVQQNGLTVTMIVTTTLEDREDIERDFELYQGIVCRETEVRELNLDALSSMELRWEIRNAYNRIEMQRELLEHKEATIDKLCYLMACSQSSQPVIDIDVKTELSAIDKRDTPEIASLQESLKRMELLLKDYPLESKEVTEIIESLDGIKNQPMTPEDVKHISIMKRLNEFLTELQNPQNKTMKVIEACRTGIDVAQDVIEYYNCIAKWCGMPVVPEPFLRRKKG